METSDEITIESSMGSLDENAKLHIGVRSLFYVLVVYVLSVLYVLIKVFRLVVQWILAR